jgi:hypothetical protein
MEGFKISKKIRRIRSIRIMRLCKCKCFMIKGKRREEISFQKFQKRSTI